MENKKRRSFQKLLDENEGQIDTKVPNDSEFQICVG